MPSFDFGAVDCWYETLFNRTYVEPRSLQRLDANAYLSLVHVRYQHLKAEARGAPLNMTNFNCKRIAYDV
ncbi:hypothetical protein AAVH_37108 [Aphelenchoides avenae]|nr:hypothetical protein AAVH_37108 [Aphelenchus avenae]